MSIVVPDVPLWLQNDIYPARIDRALIDAIWTEGIIDGFAVSQRAAGANFSVDVAAGHGAIHGDDQSAQGGYLAYITGTTNVPIAVPDSLARVDLIILRINDPQAGGTAGNNATIEPLKGTPSASNPQPPALPASAIELARVTVSAGASSITSAVIDINKRAAATVRAFPPARPFTNRLSQAAVSPGTSGGVAPPAYPGYWDLTTTARLTFRRSGLISVNLELTRTGSPTDFRARINVAGSADLYSTNSGAGGVGRGWITWLHRVNSGDTCDFYATNLVGGPITLDVVSSCAWLGD